MSIIAIAFLIVKIWLALLLVVACYAAFAGAVQGSLALCKYAVKPAEPRKHVERRKHTEQKPRLGYCLLWAFALAPVFCAIVIIIHGSN
jgi:accessory gene regulator protein AgrB